MANSTMMYESIYWKNGVGGQTYRWYQNTSSERAVSSRFSRKKWVGRKTESALLSVPRLHALDVTGHDLQQEELILWRHWGIDPRPGVEKKKRERLHIFFLELSFDFFSEPVDFQHRHCLNMAKKHDSFEAYIPLGSQQVLTKVVGPREPFHHFANLVY